MAFRDSLTHFHNLSWDISTSCRLTFLYLTHRDFQDRFEEDGFLPELSNRPMCFSKGDSNNYEFLLRKRTNYDEYVLYADREFGRLMDELGDDQENWRTHGLILTSDHGEMFERGIQGIQHLCFTSLSSGCP